MYFYGLHLNSFAFTQRERPKYGECQFLLVNVSILIVASCMSETFAKYTYFSLILANFNILDTLMVDVEHVGEFDFLLSISGLTKRKIKRNKCGLTFLFPLS